VLGIEQNGELEVRWKVAKYAVTGPAKVATACRRCSSANEILVGRGA